MKTPAEFRSFYDRELLPVLKTLEVERKKLVRRFWIFALIALIPPVISVVFNMDGNSIIIISIATLVVTILIYAIMSHKKFREIKLIFKEKVIGSMVKAIDPSLSYQHQSCISSSEYHASKLFLSDINRYKGDDLVSGMVGQTAIRFSELLTQKVTKSTDSKGNTKETTTTIFKGLFFVGDFNKHFKGETVVLPDTAESLFGSLGTMFQKMNMSRDQLIKLEDPEFEKAFAVYGNDQVEARYILSTALMRRILDFKAKAKSDIRMSFINSKVFIAIRINNNLFEAPFFKSMLDYKLIESFNFYLILFVGIVEDLNLNTRIWTKE